MKPALQKSPIAPDRAFEVKYLKAPHFDPNWHFHPEYQLFIVLKGSGTRFIGDHVSPFRNGDLVFTGPNLPHLWRSDIEYFRDEKELWTEGIVIYFHEHFLGNEFLHQKEMYLLRQLFLKAQRGMEITGVVAEQAEGLMVDLLTAVDFQGILNLLELLNLLSKSASYNLLSSAGYSNSLKQSDTDRMNRVHEYVMKNFKQRITLEEVSAVANMAPTSFSRYFKIHANKTFSDFLTEIRIGYSCKLLIQKKMNIAQVCYESGFNTVSNFNRQFKATTHYNPLEYKKKYAEVGGV